LGRALVRKPKIFLFDEPLSGLDAKMKNQMCVELGRLHSRLQATMVLVTHDQNEAMTMGDRVVCLANGKIQQVGTPMELYEHPANEFVASFIGVPPMNIFAAQWTRDGLYFEKAGYSFPVSEKLASQIRNIPRMLIGVRPEFFTITAAAPKTIVATVEVLEHLGYETLVYVQCNNLSLVVRVPPFENLAVGEKIYLTLDEKNIHFFDISTGVKFL
ncbi:MAG: TOBE domain-containing protein, partial [Fibrobacter sp.]|nr:TOBE domain-containing protein [Fibrobacter sp.]